MNRVLQAGFVLSIFIFSVSCSEKPTKEQSTQPVYEDVLYEQDLSIKYELQTEGVSLEKVYSDRNGIIQIYSSAGLLKTFAGEFLYPGTLVSDKTYRPHGDKKILNLDLYENQFVYLEDRAVFSNAWAGELYSRYTLPNASLFEGGESFAFLVSDGQSLQYLKDSKVLWSGKNGEKIIDILFDKSRNQFWLLAKGSVYVFSLKDQSLTNVFSGNNLTCFTLANTGKDIVIGTSDGYLIVDAESKQQKGEISKKLPWTETTTVQEIDGSLWFGTTKGAFTTGKDGKFIYYSSKRWLPSDNRY
jgi:hypothetical protein